MKALRLDIDLHYYWHAGTGSSSGTHLDALCERDGDDLPFLSGRHLKGLLRHAVHRAEAWGWFATQALPSGPVEDWETLLFGTRSQSAQRFQTLPGMLVMGDARLPDDERDWLNEQAAYKLMLFEELYSTAINEKGSARSHSLRGIEAALPMNLTALLQWEVTGLDPAHRQQQRQALEKENLANLLQAALPLVDAVGASRTRGLGEASLTLTTNQGGRA